MHVLLREGPFKAERLTEQLLLIKTSNDQTVVLSKETEIQLVAKAYPDEPVPGSVVLDYSGTAWQRGHIGWRCPSNLRGVLAWHELCDQQNEDGPLVVLHEPPDAAPGAPQSAEQPLTHNHLSTHVYDAAEATHKCRSGQTCQEGS